MTKSPDILLHRRGAPSDTVTASICGLLHDSHLHVAHDIAPRIAFVADTCSVSSFVSLCVTLSWKLGRISDTTALHGTHALLTVHSLPASSLAKGCSKSLRLFALFNSGTACFTSYLTDRALTACRRSPAVLERSHWSDAQGSPLNFQSGQSPRHCLASWEVVVTVSTDADGWQYASVFK